MDPGGLNVVCLNHEDSSEVDDVVDERVAGTVEGGGARISTVEVNDEEDISDDERENLEAIFRTLGERYGKDEDAKRREARILLENDKIVGEGRRPRIRHEVVERQEVSALDGRVTDVITKVVLRGATDVVDQARVIDVLNSFFVKVRELFHEHITSIAKPDDRAQVVIFTDTLQHPVSTKIQAAQTLTPEHILTKVQDAQTSEATVKFSDKLQIHFLLFKKDEGWVRDDAAVASTSGFPGRGNRGDEKYLLQWYQFAEKHSIMVVKSPNGECLASAVVRAVVELEYKRIKSVTVSKGGKGAEKKAVSKMKPEERVLYNLRLNLRKNPDGRP
jgi:hypothetical protein